MYVSLTGRATAVVIARDGLLLLARELPWGHEDGDGEREDPFDTRIVAELRRSLLFFRQSFRSAADAVVLCGDMTNLRALTTPLESALGVPVQTLDSLSGIDAAVPAPADVFRADVSALRLAIAAGSEQEPYANLLPAPTRRSGASRAIAGGVAAAALTLIALTLGYGLRRWSGTESASTQN